MKTWLREIVHEDGGELKTMEARGELQGKLVKLTPLEEAVAAAAAAASVKAAYAAPEIPIANGTHSQDIPDSKSIVVSTLTD